MKYNNMTRGIFLERPNRFIAYVEIDGKLEKVHVKNTARCKELLVPGATVHVQKADQLKRKTMWDLIAVEKRYLVQDIHGKWDEKVRIVNIDSQAPNQAVKEWLEEGHLIPDITKIQPECRYGNSRFDLYVETNERRIFIEVKGVSLEENGKTLFPDAPSERAVKHLEELIHAVEEGYEAFVFFVIQMKDVDYFTPNIEMHPEFGRALANAASHGVGIVAYDCRVETDQIEIADPIPVILEEKNQPDPFNSKSSNAQKEPTV